MTLHRAIEGNLKRTQFSFGDELVTLSEPLGQSAEYIRALRTHVITQHLEAGRRALAICEASPKMGASFVAINLAAALAQAGVKTLLIDGNLRAPTLHYVIRPDRETEGLRECLRSADALVGDYVHYDVMPNLSVLFAGGVAPNAQELLAHVGFEQIINSCLRDFTMTIIDTPPANSCADVLRIASLTGYSLIVSRRHRGLVSDAKVLASQLEASRSTVIGTVMNDA